MTSVSQAFLNNTTYSTNLPPPAPDTGAITHAALINWSSRLSDRFAQLFGSNPTETHIQFQNYIHVKLDKSAQHLHPNRALDFIFKGSQNVVAITLHAPIDPGSELSRNGFLASGVHDLHFFFQTKEAVDRVLSKLPPVDWRNLQIPLRAEDGKYYQDPTTQEPITSPPTLLAHDSVSVTVGVLTPSHHTRPPPGSRYNTQPSNNTAGRGSRTRPSYEQTDLRATSRQRTTQRLVSLPCSPNSKTYKIGKNETVTVLGSCQTTPHNLLLKFSNAHVLSHTPAPILSNPSLPTE